MKNNILMNLGSVLLLTGMLVFINCKNGYSQYSELKEFGIGTDGQSYLTNEFISDGTYFYGTVLSGGTQGLGYIFRMDLEGNNIQDLFDFSSTNIGLDNTSISLIVSESILYGVADKGGANSNGMIFKIKTDGTEFFKLYDFDGSNGSNPYGRMNLINTNLIGTTLHGGADNLGTILKFNLNTGLLTKMFEFSTSNGSIPTGGQILKESFLYGTTSFGGLNSEGVLYKINYDGSGFEVLYNFANSSGSKPKGSLTMIDSYIYGSTSTGGTNNMGTIFRIDSSGTGYERLVSFSGINGNSPQGNITLINNRIYGTTMLGGEFNSGVIFLTYTDRSDFKVLHSFRNDGTRYPKGQLAVSGSNLIGTTSTGGTLSGGVIFKFNTGYPKKQPSNIVLSNFQPGQMNLDGWYNCDGTSVIVFMKKGTDGSPIPVDGKPYNANTIFGQGSQIGTSGWFCIYKNSNNSLPTPLSITGLEPNTSYRIMVITFNGIPNEEKYLLSTESENPKNVSTKEGVIGSKEDLSSVIAYSKSFSYSHTIENEGINPLISNGICWAKQPTPTLKDNKYIEGSGPGIYNITIGNLDQSTTYYYRSVLIYPADTVYSNISSFTTLNLTTQIDLAYEMLMPPLFGTYFYDFGVDPNNWIYGSIAGGEATKGTDAGDQPDINPLMTYTTTPTNPYLNGKWKILNKSIKICNDAILAINEVYPEGNINREPKLAQIRFLRAFFYFELIKMFGANLPWMDENNMLANEPMTTLNSTVILPNVENDFIYSIEYLPEISDKPGHPNVWAAKAFYAKLLLYEKRYSEAKTVFTDVINNGKTTKGEKYALLNHFEYNFNRIYNNNSESVLAQQPDSRFERANPGYILAGPYNPNFGSGCCGFFQPSHFLVNSFKVDNNGLPMFDPGHNTFPFDVSDIKNDEGIIYTAPYTYDSEISIDPRLDWTVGRRGIMYLDWGINPGSSLIRDQSYGGCFVGVKHNFTKLDRQTGNVSQGGWVEISLINYNLMRFSDLLLMDAECEIEAGDPEKARFYVNQIRTRANNSHVKNDGVNDACNYQVGLYTTPWTKDNFSREAVRFERKLELGMEGHRFFDLVRWGADYASKELNQGYIPNEARHRTFFAGVSFNTCLSYFPIPQSLTLYLPEIRHISDPSMTLSAYSPSGLKINYYVDDPSVVKIDGNKLVIMGLGVASVTATQSVNSVCFPASSVTKVISVLEDPILNVSPSELILPYTAISSTLSINSNNNWIITCSQAWLKTDHPSGAGNTIVSLEVQENTLDVPRIAFVTIYSLGLPEKIITVTQNTAAPTTTLTQPTCTVATGTITVTAPTGTGMTYSIDGSTYTNTTGIFTSVAAGTYTVTAKNSSGFILAGTSVTINAQPATPPTAVITQKNNLLKSSSKVGNQWYNSSGIISNATDSTYAPISNGNYYVIVTLNGCSSGPSNTISYTTGIEKNEVFKGISIYPNPAFNNLIIENDNFSRPIDFDIINADGMKIYTSILNNKSVIDLAQFSSGFYFIRFEEKGSYYVLKFVKE